jgi:hypothetical protein
MIQHDILWCNITQHSGNLIWPILACPLRICPLRGSDILIPTVMMKEYKLHEQSSKFDSWRKKKCCRWFVWYALTKRDTHACTHTHIYAHMYTTHTDTHSIVEKRTYNTWVWPDIPINPLHEMHSPVRYIMGVEILVRYPRLEGVRGETSLRWYIKKDGNEGRRKQEELLAYCWVEEED